VLTEGFWNWSPQEGSEGNIYKKPWLLYQRTPQCSKRPENIINRKITNFYIEAMPKQISQLPPKIFLCRNENFLNFFFENPTKWNLSIFPTRKIRKCQHVKMSKCWFFSDFHFLSDFQNVDFFFRFRFFLELRYFFEHSSDVKSSNLSIYGGFGAFGAHLSRVWIHIRFVVPAGGPHLTAKKRPVVARVYWAVHTGSGNCPKSVQNLTTRPHASAWRTP